MKISRFLFLSILVLSTFSLSAQGWEATFGGGNSITRALEAIQTEDGNYLVAGQSGDGLANGDPGPFVIKISDDGETMWELLLSETTIANTHIVASANDTYLVKHATKETVNGISYSKSGLVMLDTDGNILWENRFLDGQEGINNIDEILANDDGTFTFGAYVNAIDSIYIGQMDADGNLLSLNLVSPFINSPSLFESNNGNYYFKGHTVDTSLVLYETDLNGNLLDVTPYSGHSYYSSVYLLDNNDIVLIQGFPIYDGQIQIRVSDQNIEISRDTIWEIENGVTLHRGATQLNDGFILAATVESLTDISTNVLLIRTDFDGNVLWDKSYTHRPGTQEAFDVISAHDGGFIVAGSDRIVGSPHMAYVFKTDENGVIYTNVISGKVAIDNVADCIVDQNDQAIEAWIITADKGTQTFVTTSDEYGNYILPVDTGNYVLTLHPPSNYWAACANNIGLSFTNFDNTEIVDFPVQKSILCPTMVVNGTAAAIRPCFERPSYVNYCNYGTTTAEVAYIEITYDTFITPMSSSIPWISLPNNVYRFDIGDIDPLECGDFTVNLFLDCNASVGAGYCIEAHAYPDTICYPISDEWSGAFLEVSGTCEEDNIQFRIQNVGDGAMEQHSDYIIVEDVILIMMDSVELGSGQFEDFPVLANGSTYTIMVDQVPNAPGNSNPIAIVEGCGENGTGEFSVEFTNQFPLDDSNLYYDIDCPIATNSFDPNDKQAFPIGYSEEHLIRKNTEIEYLIRFQNTGTDTAYTVVVKDTLDAWLDISSFQRGASSHPYDFQIKGEGVLVFTFENILLPDSSANLIGSNGFIEFKISPKENIPLATVIRNDAAIYFDFNAPIITNETFHKIAEDFIEVTVGTTNHPAQSNILVNVHPNPFIDQAIFEVKNHKNNNYLLEVYDASGRLVREERYANTSIVFYKKQLTKGLYFYRLSAPDGLVNTGKIILK